MRYHRLLQALMLDDEDGSNFDNLHMLDKAYSRVLSELKFLCSVN